MASSNLQRIQFGEFILDLNRGTLQRSGNDIGLRPQVFEVLSFLANRKGSLVSREELKNAVWGDTTVTDDSLTQCIVEIRRAIDDQSHVVIRTVPRRGFIFDPPDTTSVDEADTSAPPAAARSGSYPGSWFGGLAVAGIAVVAIVALLAMVDVRPTAIDAGAGPDLPSNSIAVLPFADMSQTGDQQYFGDGIAEEILTKLTHYPGLVVISRTSSFLYRDRQADVIDIGRSLNAAFVLEGSVRRSGSRLRITAQLIDTQTGAHEWSQSFDRELSVDNLLDIQAEVAERVAASIGTDTSRFVRRGGDRNTANADAYERYLEGMFYLQQIRTAEREDFDIDVYRKAMERFSASIDIDPDWAASHAALGRTMHFYAGTFQGHKDEETYHWLRLAKQHLEEAIRLDPGYALAYSSLGHVVFSLDFDFAAANAAYERARTLGNYFPWGYALFLAKSGRFDEAIEEYKRAIERDPLTVGPRLQLAGTYLCARRFTESIAEYEKVLRMAPGRDDLYIQLTYLYAKTGDYQKALQTLKGHLNPEFTPLRYAPAYAVLGMKDTAYELLDQSDPAERWWLEDMVSTYLILGEKDPALDILEAAFHEDPRRLMHALCRYDIGLLDGDPRFEQLLRKAGFPDSHF